MQLYELTENGVQKFNLFVKGRVDYLYLLIINAQVILSVTSYRISSLSS